MRHPDSPPPETGYWEVKPEQSLSHVIEAFWSYAPDFPEPRWDILVPEGIIDVIINFGDPYFRQPAGSVQQPGSWITEDVLVGQRDCLFKIQWPVNTRLFAIRFNAAHIHRLIQRPMHELTNAAVALSDTPLHHLSLQLKQHQLDDWSVLTELCEQLIADCLSKAPPANALLLDAMNRIDQQAANMDVGTLCQTLHTSRRTLERLFRKHIGLTPKYYLRAKRLHHFLCHHQPHHALINSAMDAEYHDQSHFIKEFKQFTGETPKVFFDSPPDIYQPLLTSLLARMNKQN